MCVFQLKHWHVRQTPPKKKKETEKLLKVKAHGLVDDERGTNDL